MHVFQESLLHKKLTLNNIIWNINILNVWSRLINSMPPCWKVVIIYFQNKSHRPQTFERLYAFKRKCIKKCNYVNIWIICIESDLIIRCCPYVCHFVWNTCCFKKYIYFSPKHLHFPSSFMLLHWRLPVTRLLINSSKSATKECYLQLKLKFS